jgi:hypothetical protein
MAAVMNSFARPIASRSGSPWERNAAMAEA